MIWFGGHRVDNGQMEVGALTAFLSYLMQILMSVMMATFMLMMVPRASVCGDRIAEVLDTRTSVPPPEDPVLPDPARRGWLDLEDVTFAYPGAEAPVLSEVSFSARPGPDGRGDRLDRRRQVDAGQPGAAALRRDRRAWCASAAPTYADVDPEALWSQIGLVPQKAYLFSGTVRSNLLHGKPDATEDEIWAALEVAQARDFVEALAEGLDAPVAQGGTNFSGGQRQRLAIARALVRRPGDLPVRRLVLGARPGHRRAAARGAAADDDATRRS